MRKFLLIACLSILLMGPGGLYAQSAKISLNLVNVSLNDVLNQIEQKSDFKFVINQKNVDLTKKVTAVYTDTSIGEILKDLFNEKDFEISVVEKQIVINPKVKEQQDYPRKIEGRIVDDQTGEPLPGASVVIKDRNKGTISDINGNFTIEVSSPDDILLVSFVGYAPQEISCRGIVFLNVRMRESAVQMGDVVVTALGIRREEKAIG